MFKISFILRITTDDLLDLIFIFPSGETKGVCADYHGNWFFCSFCEKWYVVQRETWVLEYCDGAIRLKKKISFAQIVGHTTKQKRNRVFALKTFIEFPAAILENKWIEAQWERWHYTMRQYPYESTLCNCMK